MGLGLIIAATTLAITLAMTAYALISAGQNADNMEPQQLSDFKPTMAKEGAAIALIYGRVRLPGNIIWWGNLRTQEITQGMGGKGLGGGGEVVTGYRYFVDCWQAIGYGKLSLIKTYVSDKEKDLAPDTTELIWNNGEDIVTPPITESYINNIPKVAWLYLGGWYIGDNVSSIPTLHFVVEKELDTPCGNNNLSSGSNPAAVIYDLLVNVAGIHYTKINLSLFQAAATYFANKQMGINLKFDQQIKLSEAIETVLKYIDGVFYVDSDGLYCLRVLDPNDIYEAMINQERIKDFSLNRKAWSQIPNLFVATYFDEEQDFSTRTVNCENPAAIRLTGNKIQRNIDLKCFRDATSANKRVWEIMKRSSYPIAKIKFKTDLSLSMLLPGSVFRLSHSDYGIENADFRITTIDASSLDKNEIGIEAIQVAETLFDDNFLDPPGPEWEPPDTEPIPLNHVKVFELPYNRRTEEEAAFLVLAAREKLNETSFVVIASNEETGDYQTFGEFDTYSLRGTLDQEYTISTKIDDSEGIVFTPYKFDPEFFTISRTNLFTANRIAIIENELISFQQVLPLGGGSYKLLGCIRGILATEQKTHVAGKEIWLAYFSDNVLEKIPWDTFFVKVLPRFQGNIVDAASVTAVQGTKTAKAKKPREVSRIVAERIGNNISFQLWPSSPGVPGAGDYAPDLMTDKEPPFDFRGDFIVEWNSNSEIKATDSFVVIQAGTTTFTIKSRLNSYISTGKQIIVEATDGTYKA